jgi:DNA polymerase III epsilon subunit-like protein
LGVDTLYTSDNHAPFFLDEKTLKKIYQKAQEKFGIEFKISDFYEGQRALLSLEKEEGMKEHKVKNITDVSIVEENHSQNSTYGKKEQVKDIARKEQKAKRMEVLEAEIEIRREKERQEFDKASNLLRDFINDKVVSIDFEFFINKDDSYHVTELGIAFNENGKNQAFHFLIEEHYQKKKNQALQKRFDFGETQVIKEKQIPKLIEMAIQNAKYILFHEQREDYEILNQMGIKIPEEITVIDTQLSYKRYFRKKGSLPNGEKLEGLLSMCKIPYKNLHNAGNDAYMTLMLLQKMSAIQQHLSEAQPVVKKIKIK